MNDVPDAPVPADDDDVRHLLRGLPEVAPPEGFFDDLIRRRRRRARAIAVGGIAAAGVVGAMVVAQATGIHGDAEPAMGDLAERHEEVMAVPASAIRGVHSRSVRAYWRTSARSFQNPVASPAA